MSDFALETYMGWVDGKLRKLLHVDNGLTDNHVATQSFAENISLSTSSFQLCRLPTRLILAQRTCTQTLTLIGDM